MGRLKNIPKAKKGAWEKTSEKEGKKETSVSPVSGDRWRADGRPPVTAGGLPSPSPNVGAVPPFWEPEK